MSEDASPKFKFSGHQTFAFRYGWLEKGVRGVGNCPTLFSEEDALVRLGVGKNMVASIRHWCQVTQLAEPDPVIQRNKGRVLRASEMGRRLLGAKGWDPFMENDATLWLIHWLLVTNQTIGTTWQLLFARYHRPDFTKRELIDYVLSFVERESLKAKESVIARDVDCFLRTYAVSDGEKKRATPEETFSCPLLELNLIRPTPDGDLYRFSIGPKPSLCPAVFAYALYQHYFRARAGRSTMSIQECLYGDGSPGQVFKLDENSLMDYVERLEDMTSGAVLLDETAGLKQIYRRDDFEPYAMLDKHYRGGDNI
jgi:hypothetical protein